MWLIINLAEMETTPIIDISLYVVGILLLLNLILTFTMTIACTAGSDKIAYLFWYLVVLLIFLEFFFLAFFAGYMQPFVRLDFKRELLGKINSTLLEDMEFIDNIQSELQCCGAEGPNDWLKVGKHIPDSCCDARENGGQLVIIKCPRYGIWYCTKGCADQETDFIEPYPELIIQALWRLGFFHIILLVGAFWYRVMLKMDMMDRLMNKGLIEEFPPLPKPRNFPQEPSPTTYYNTVYNKDHYMELMIKGESAGRYGCS